MTKTTENSPMILPWLAHQAGTSGGRAEVLWADACRRAASLTGEYDGSLYWGAAQQIVLELLREERWRTCPPPAWLWLLMQDGVERWSGLILMSLRSAKLLDLSGVKLALLKLSLGLKGDEEVRPRCNL